MLLGVNTSTHTERNRIAPCLGMQGDPPGGAGRCDLAEGCLGNFA